MPALADAASKIKQVNATPDKQELFMKRAQKNEVKYEKEAAEKKILKEQKPSIKGSSTLSMTMKTFATAIFINL